MEETLESGMYKLLLKTNEKIALLEGIVSEEKRMPEDFEAFKELKGEDQQFLVGSLSSLSLVLGELSKLYQIKINAINIIVDKNTNVDNQEKLKLFTTLFKEGLKNFDESDEVFDKIIEKVMKEI